MDNEGGRLHQIRALCKQVEQVHQLCEEGDWDNAKCENDKFSSALRQVFLTWDRDQALTLEEQNLFKALETRYQQALAVQMQRHEVLAGEMKGLMRGRQGVESYKSCQS